MKIGDVLHHLFIDDLVFQGELNFKIEPNSIKIDFMHDHDYQVCGTYLLLVFFPFPDFIFKLEVKLYSGENIVFINENSLFLFVCMFECFVVGLICHL